jgi:hypothetical protein
MLSEFGCLTYKSIIFVKVKLKPKPWSAKWQLWDLKGIEDISGELEPWQEKKLETFKFQTGYEAKPYDLMKTYR